MKLQRQLSMAKLANAARDLLVFMARTKLPLLSVGAAVAAKCRELWGGLITRGGCCAMSRARPADDDYFRWSYEFSCTATPVNALAVRGPRLQPCFSGGKGWDVMQGNAAPRDDEGRASPEPPEWSSPGPRAAGGHEIDGLADEFINWFREQLRMQGVAYGCTE
jgi:hypothetical protein